MGINASQLYAIFLICFVILSWLFLMSGIVVWLKILDKKSLDLEGILVSFRRRSLLHTFEVIDYLENLYMSVPVIQFEYKGQQLILASDEKNLHLGNDDIGHKIKIRIRESLWINMVAHNSDNEIIT